MYSVSIPDPSDAMSSLVLQISMCAGNWREFYSPNKRGYPEASGKTPKLMMSMSNAISLGIPVLVRSFKASFIALLFGERCVPNLR